MNPKHFRAALHALHEQHREEIDYLIDRYSAVTRRKGDVPTRILLAVQRAERTAMHRAGLLPGVRGPSGWRGK